MLQVAVNREAPTSSPLRNLVPQVRALAEQVAVAIQSGRLDQARRMVRQYTLPPIAWGFLASCLQQNAIGADVIERVLT